MIELIALDAFLLALRESMEASLIVGIIIAMLKKIKANHLIIMVWVGAFTGILGSLLTAAIIQVTFGGLEGNAEKIFEGSVMFIATIILTSMILWNANNGKKLAKELKEKTIQLKEKSRYSLLGFVFILVFREGVELALFFLGIRAQGTTMNAILFSGTIGIITSICLAGILFHGSVKLNIKAFFTVTNIFLLFFAAGLLAHSVHEFQELGWLGSGSIFWNVVLWDTSRVLNDETDVIGMLFRSLMGYQDKPSLLEVVVYVGYTIIVSYVLFWKKRS